MTLIDTYLSVCSMFNDGDMTVRPHPRDPRGRCLLERMVYHCVSENLWFKNMLPIGFSPNAYTFTHTWRGP